MNNRIMYRQNAIDGFQVYLILRFTIFILIAWTAYTSLQTELQWTPWIALGYFALSEILLLVRSRRWVKQSIAIGIYFLDVVAVSLFIRMYDVNTIWYMTLPVLMIGVTLCYYRKWAWLPIGAIPSVLIIYQQSFQNGMVIPENLELPGMVFLLFVYALVLYLLTVQMNQASSLYQGQRKLVHDLPDLSGFNNPADCTHYILNREAPLEVSFSSILFEDHEGNLSGWDKRDEGGVENVLLGSQRAPSVFSLIKKAETRLTKRNTKKEKNEYLKVRKIGSLIGRPFFIGEQKGLILFGRKRSNGFSKEECEILTTYTEMIIEWIARSCEQEKRVLDEPVPKKSTETGVEPEPLAASERAAGAHNTERLNALKIENSELRQSLDEQIGIKTEALKNTIVSLMEQESVVDQKVFEKLASVEINRAVSMFFSLELILDLIIDILCEKLLVRTASIMLFREERKDFTIAAYHGLNDETVQKTRLMVGEAIAGYAAVKSEPLLILDIERDPRFVAFQPDAFRPGSLLCIPIRYGESVLGVMNLSDREEDGPLTDRDMDIIQVLSKQAAIAIVNHQLYLDFESGQQVREVYEEGLARKFSEKVFQEDKILEKTEGEYAVTLVSIHLHEKETEGDRPKPEDRLQQIDEQFQTIREIFIRYKGDVIGDTGVGMLGVFGLPFADVKDSWRAVLAAADLLKNFSRLVQASQLKNGSSFQVSVGVATGDLLIRDQKGTKPYALFGKTWERAQVLMQAGLPGQILIDEETFEKIQNRVNGIRLEIPYGIKKKLTVYGVKGFKK